MELQNMPISQEIDKIKIERKTRLTDEESKQITDNLPEIKRFLHHFIRKFRINYGKFDKREVFYEALGFVPDAAIEYYNYKEKNKDKDDYYPKFLAIRAFLRSIDQYRDMHKMLVSRSKKKLIDGIKEKLRSEYGVCPEEEFYEEMKKNGYSFKDLTFLPIDICFSNDEIDKKISFSKDFKNHINQEIAEIDWQDQLKNMIQMADKIFFESPQFSNTKNSENNTRRKLIKEYILPKANSLEYKTLSEISQEVGKTEGRLSQMNNDEVTKGFFQSFYE